jgi:hypothetical protein
LGKCFRFAISLPLQFSPLLFKDIFVSSRKGHIPSIKAFLIELEKKREFYTTIKFHSSGNFFLTGVDGEVKRQVLMKENYHAGKGKCGKKFKRSLGHERVWHIAEDLFE